MLRALDYFRAAGDAPDSQLAEAVATLRAKQQPDGTWLLEHTYPGAVHFSMEDGDGAPQSLEHPPRASRAELVRRQRSAPLRQPPFGLSIVGQNGASRRALATSVSTGSFANC